MYVSFRVLNLGTAATLGWLIFAVGEQLQGTSQVVTMSPDKQQWTKKAAAPAICASGAWASTGWRGHCFGASFVPSPPHLRMWAGTQVLSSSLVPKGQAVGWTLAVASTCSYDNHPQACPFSVPQYLGAPPAQCSPHTHTPVTEWVPKTTGRQSCPNQPRSRRFKSSKFRDHGY